MKTEDLKVCLEDLHKVLSEVQEMREQQNSMDVRLANMKRWMCPFFSFICVLVLDSFKKKKKRARP